MKTYRISLGAYQDAELSAFKAGFVTADHHKHNEADIEKLALIAIDVDKALLASNRGTVITDINSALSVVQEIEANDITAVGDPTERSLAEASVAGLSNLLQQVSLSIGVK